MTEIYEEGNGPPRFVARLSRTAQGVRTFTVGMSLGGADITRETVANLFRLERAISTEIDGPRKSARLSGQSVTAQMRRSIITETLKKSLVTSLLRKTGLTTAGLVALIDGAKRSQLVADLSYLVREGHVEVEQSKGRTPSRYRLAPTLKHTAQKKEGK